MGKFTDKKPLPVMPPNQSALHAPDGDGIQSQSWSDDLHTGTAVPLIHDEEMG